MDGPKCTDMCKMKTCENQKFDDEEPALDMDYSDESDDEDDDTEWDISGAFVLNTRIQYRTL